jgi:hypothetical protein
VKWKSFDENRLPMEFSEVERKGGTYENSEIAQERRNL